MSRTTFFALLLSLALGAAPKPVETAVYRTGAWFAPNSEEQREMYLKGGFTMVPYTNQCRDWAAEHDMVFIGGVGSYGLPGEVAKPFESNDGAQSMSVGLFTHINFNAPSVAKWWDTRVPEVVRGMTHAERVAYWKVHNEFGYHAGKVYDYSPGSIAKYRSWLVGRYDGIGDLNAKWKSKHASFETIEPPRTREQMKADMGNWLEWRRFTCWNFADYFKTTGDLIRTVVPGAKVADNFYTTSPMQGWDNFALARQVDYLAYDIYDISRWQNLLDKLDHCRTGAAAYGIPFIIMEYHAGPNHFVPEVTRRDLLIESNVALARECRAIQWFRWIPGGSGREEGIHGMMDSKGQPTERFTAAAETAAFAQRLAPLFLNSRTVAPVAVVTSQDATYLAYANSGSTWGPRRRWDFLNRMLNAARIQFDEVDPVWLENEDPSRYQAILVGSVPVLSDGAMAKLRAFAAQGGTVFFHPDSAILDGYGQPRGDSPYLTASTKQGGWTVRNRRDGRGPVVVEPIGKGRFVQCAWELPAKFEPGDEGVAEYARLLADQAGVRSFLAETVPAPDPVVDVRLLEAGPCRLVFATDMRSAGEARTVRLALRDLRPDARVFALNPRTAKVTRLAVDNGTISLGGVAPGAMALVADKPWQPLLGLDAPKMLHPGDRFVATVTIDNLDGVAVSGRADLAVPEGWQATCRNPEFADLAPGARATLAFAVTVPATATIDHFGIENPMVASATFAAGRSGTLSVRHLPFVLPQLDVRLAYAERDLNPWQEMQPPVLRWGWDNEVITPPAPPVSCRANAPVSMRVRCAPSLKGKTLALNVTGPGQPMVTPSTVTLAELDATQQIALFLPESAEYEVTATCGDATFVIPIVSGVHTDTVAAAAKAARTEIPADCVAVARLGVGTRDAAAMGDVVSFAVDTGGQKGNLAVFDASGKQVAASVGGSTVTLAADVPKDGVGVYALVRCPRELPAPPRVRMERIDANALAVSGDSYRICFDTNLGLVRWLELDGKRVAPYRTGLVAVTEGGTEQAPDAMSRVDSLAISSSPVGADVEISALRHGLRVVQKWRLEAARLSVELRVSNEERQPLSFGELRYEFGFDPKQLPNWRRVSAEGTQEEGTMPTGFGPMRGAPLADFLNDGGDGIAVRPGRCAMITKWQTGPTGLLHTVSRTALGLLRNLRMDPGDTILAEFELLPHAGALQQPVAPVLVTATDQP
jgi:hypothetical protein